MRFQECLRSSGVTHMVGMWRWMGRKSLRKTEVKRKGIAADVKEQLECVKLFCGMGNSVVETLEVRIREEASKFDIVVAVHYRPSKSG